MLHVLFEPASQTKDTKSTSFFLRKEQSELCTLGMAKMCSNYIYAYQPVHTHSMISASNMFSTWEVIICLNRYYLLDSDPYTIILLYNGTILLAQSCNLDALKPTILYSKFGAYSHPLQENVFFIDFERTNS